MSLLLEIMGQSYDQILTKLAKGFEFVIKDGGWDVQLKIKTIDMISWWTDLINKCQTKTEIY